MTACSVPTRHSARSHDAPRTSPFVVAAVTRCRPAQENAGPARARFIRAPAVGPRRIAAAPGGLARRRRVAACRSGTARSAMTPLLNRCPFVVSTAANPGTRLAQPAAAAAEAVARSSCAAGRRRPTPAACRPARARADRWAIVDRRSLVIRRAAGAARPADMRSDPALGSPASAECTARQRRTSVGPSKGPWG